MGSCVTGQRATPNDRVRSHVPSTVISSSKFDLKFAEELQRATQDIQNVTLDFRVRVHNFRARLPFVVSRVSKPKTMPWLRITFGGLPKYTFVSEMSQEKDHGRWNLDHSFELSCPYKELNKTFFSVVSGSEFQFVFDGKTNEKAAELAIDYYMLAIGPHHFDIQLRSLRASKTLGRISFNVEFANFERMVVALRSVKCSLYHPEPTMYSLSFRTTSTNETEESGRSPSAFSSYDGSGSAVEWNFGHLQQRPEIQMDLTFEQLRLSSFQMLIWRLEGKSPTAKMKSRKTASFKSQSPQETKRADILARSQTIKRASGNRADALGFYRIDSLVPETISMIKHYSEYQPANNFSSSDLPRAQSFSKTHHKKDSSKLNFNVELIEPESPGLNTNENPFALHLKEVEPQEDELEAECYISFQKLLQEEVKLFDRKDSSFLSSAVYEHSETANQDYMNAKRRRSSLDGEEDLLQVLNQPKGTKVARKLLKRFESSLWLSGQVIGKITGTIEIVNTPFLHQMMFGVCTEHGVKIASVSVLHDTSWFERVSTKKQAMLLPDKVKQLFQMKQNLMRYHQRGKLPMKSRPSVSFTQNVLKDMVDLLGESDKSSMVSFFYQNESALLQSQQLLIELGFHFLEFSDFVRYEFRNWYFYVMEKLFKRGELDLSMMKYHHIPDLQARSEIDKKLTNQVKFFEEKHKTSLLYARLLYRTLAFVLQKLTRKGVDKVQRQFLETFLSISFFRIPEFRNRFLETITEKPFADLPEYNENLISDQEAPLGRLFDWEGFFYSSLPKNEEKEEAQLALQKTLNKEEWRQRLAKRGVAFFLIVQKWAEYVQKYTVRQQIPWHDIPGYPAIIKAVLSEMKSRDILSYPDALVDTTVILLSNDGLLSVFTMIVLKKTNAYDPYTVASTIEMLNKWFKAIGDKGRLLPSYFDFRFFFQAIDILLHLDHAISTSKCLWLLYNTFTFFPPDNRREIAARLLKQSSFFQLAFHWSWHVRNIVAHIFVYFLQHKYQYGGNHEEAISRWHEQPQNVSPPKRLSKQTTLVDLIENYSQRLEETKALSQDTTSLLKEELIKQLKPDQLLYAKHFYLRYLEVQHLYKEWSQGEDKALPNIDIRLPIDDVDGIEEW